MFVFHDPQMNVVSIAYGDPEMIPADAGPYVELPDQQFSTLAGLKVQGGTLVYADPVGVRELAFNALFKLLEEAEQTVTDRVTVGEKTSWTLKEIAARAFLAGTPTAEQQMMLSIEASYTGETLTELAQTIIAKADQYLILAPALAGVRRKYEAQIAAATSGFDVILQSAGQELLAMLTA